MRLASNVPLASLTTLRVGGPARELAMLEDLADFPELVATASRTGDVPRVIGSGSNVLAADDGYPGLVVSMATTGVRLDRARSRERILVTVAAPQEASSSAQSSPKTPPAACARRAPPSTSSQTARPASAPAG